MYVSNPSIKDLTEHVIVEILSRLHVKTIIHCKCVCKKWLDLVSDSYFANLHLSRSPAGIMIHHSSMKDWQDNKPGILKWVEVEDELNHHHLHHDPLMSLNLNLLPIIQERHIVLVGSVNGLLCLGLYGEGNDKIYICNPITREYLMLPGKQYNLQYHTTINYCFGIGSVTKEYKVVRIFKWDITPISQPSQLEAEVYTLGMGQWRNLGHVPNWLRKYYYGPFLNGYAHWSVSDQDSSEMIYTFDFDNEKFKLFPSPPVETIQDSQIHFRSLGVLKGCLCQCNAIDSQFTIWVMKEYGIQKSWHKEVIIKKSMSPNLDWLMWEPVYPIERLHDGTILMACSGKELLAYSSEKGTIAGTNYYFDFLFTGMVYRPSFLKLRNFESEIVHLF